jgi:sulfur-oxidizing protein SoxY
MKFRQFANAREAPAGKMREAQIMMRHPNNSGLQMDQVTRLYVPAFFVRELRVWQGDDLVLFMDGGISISEDPTIRFNYAPNGAKAFRAEAIDTENHVFTGTWPVDSSQM